MLLTNATGITIQPASVEPLDLRIERGTIIDRGKHLKPKPREDMYDLRGRIIMPGFVNAHTHLYSALARGMAQPAVPPKNFLEILDKIWWKLDRALDDEAIYYSGLVGAIEAVRCGTTTLVDHHASPKAIRGSLDFLKSAMSDVGLRGVLCYEVTDRGGKKEKDLGLAENERFIRSNRRDPAFRGMVGAHASFTLGNDSLRECGTLAEKLGTGVHIHVAEDAADGIDAEENYRQNIIGRLRVSGCLRRSSIFAHGVHLREEDISEVRKAGSWLVHNPRSNMNNRVGYAPVHCFGPRTALGTDGFPADMLDEARTGFFKRQDARIESTAGDVISLLRAGQELVSEIFGQKIGTLKKGSAADLIILDYQPPTPLTSGNVFGHCLFGMNAAAVESVIIRGRWVVRNRVLAGLDTDEIFRKARSAAAKLWKRMESID